MDMKLKGLAKGSAREVFKLNGKAVKIARDEKGNEQNKQEYDVYMNSTDDIKIILARILSADNKWFDWIKMELCRPATKDDFWQKFYITFDELNGILDYWYRKRWNKKIRKEPDLIGYSGKFWFKPLEKVIHRDLFSIKDLMKLSSWGVTSDDRLVLVDYGLNLDIYRKYYKKAKKK